MGFAHTEHVWAVPDLTATTKIVLLDLTRRANESKGFTTWASIATIMTDTGIRSRGTVRTSIDDLVARGFISKKPRYETTSDGHRRQTSHIYTVHLDVIAAGGRSTIDRGVGQPLTGGRSTIDHQEQGTEQGSLNKEDGYTIDPDGSTEESYTIDPDGSTALSAGERTDPISPAFHRSHDRKHLLQGVQVIAQNRADDDYKKLEHNLDQFLIALNTFFDRADENIWGADYGWEQIPSKCTSAYEAGKWLNTFLNSWQNDEGLLEWTPYDWEAAA